MTLPVFLERRREASDGAPLRVDVQAAVQHSLEPEGLDLRRLEEQVRVDPQITAVLIAAANSAGYHGSPVQTLAMALHKLAAGQSMNLILGLALKHNVVLSDPGLKDYAERYWQLSQRTADYARSLARMLDLDHERCYSAGILHRLGDLALLRCLQDWLQGGGELDDEAIGESLYTFGAAYGSALRTRWRLPLELRQLIAAIYSLEGGVYSREALVVNLAAQLARLTEHEGVEALAQSVRFAFEDRRPESMAEGLGQRVGGWLASSASLDEVAAHWSRLVLQRNDTGHACVLRFYDSRALALLWTIMSPMQQQAMLGPVRAWHVLDAGARPIVHLASSEARANFMLSAEQWQEIQRHGHVNRALALHARTCGRQPEPNEIKAAVAAAARAERYGLIDRDDWVAFIGHALSWHPQFDLHPKVLQLLAHRARDDFYTGEIEQLSANEIDEIRQGSWHKRPGASASQ